MSRLTRRIVLIGTVLGFIVACGGGGEDIGPEPAALSVADAQATLDADGSRALIGVLDHWEAEAVWAWKSANPGKSMFSVGDEIDVEVNGKLDQLNWSMPAETADDDLIFTNPSPITSCVYQYSSISFDARTLDIGGHSYEVNAQFAHCNTAVEFKQPFSYSSPTGLNAGTSIDCMTESGDKVRSWTAMGVSDDDPEGDEEIQLFLPTECIQDGVKLVFVSTKREYKSSTSTTTTSGGGGDCDEYIDCICALSKKDDNQKAACDAAKLSFKGQTDPDLVKACGDSLDALRMGKAMYKMQGMWDSACD